MYKSISSGTKVVFHAKKKPVFELKSSISGTKVLLRLQKAVFSRTEEVF